MKKFSSALVWLTVSEVVFNIAAYVVHSVAGRILGPADYGRYGLVVTLTTMVVVLIGNGIPTAMSKYVSGVLEKNPGDIRSIKKKTALLQIYIIGGITILFFLFAPVIAWALRDPSLTPLFRISSLIIPAFAAASFYHYYLIGLHLFKLQAIVKIIRSFARIGFIALAAVFFGLNGAIGGYILAPLFTFGAALLIDEFYVKRKLGYGTENKKDDFDFPAKTILVYAGPLTLFLVFYELLLTIDLYFVKALLQDDHLTGLYNAAITVGRIPYYLFAALAMILLPAISKTTAERNTLETGSLVNKSLRLMALLLFPIITLLIAYASQILHFFYGTRYVGAEATMSIFSLGVGFLTVFYVLAFALNGADAGNRFPRQQISPPHGPPSFPDNHPSHRIRCTDSPFLLWHTLRRSRSYDEHFLARRRIPDGILCAGFRIEWRRSRPYPDETFIFRIYLYGCTHLFPHPAIRDSRRSACRYHYCFCSHDQHPYLYENSLRRPSAVQNRLLFLIQRARYSLSFTFLTAWHL